LSRQALNEVLSELPYRLRERVDGYVGAVIAEAPSIFAEADAPMSKGLVDRLTFIAGVRKLWAIVDADAWLLTGAVRLVEGHDVSAISVGSTHYHRGSTTYETIITLRDTLQGQLIELGVMDYVQERSLVEVVRKLAGEQ
jgi:hypothetical protein